MFEKFTQWNTFHQWRKSKLKESTHARQHTLIGRSFHHKYKVIKVCYYVTADAAQKCALSHFNPSQANLFLRFKGPGRTPLLSQEPIKLAKWNLAQWWYYLKPSRIQKEKLRNLTYDVTMTSLLKTMRNLDLRETRQIIYHSKGNDESFPKMKFFTEIEWLNQKLWPFK